MNILLSRHFTKAGQEYRVFEIDSDTGGIGIELISDGGGWNNFITLNEFRRYFTLTLHF